MANRIYNALVLNDYPETPYAEWVKQGKKKIETRMNRLFTFRGDLVICCGKTNSSTKNAGKALCIVDLYEARPMIKEDEKDACISWDINRKSLLLRNWRHFNRDFDFAPVAIKKNFQGIFSIALPDDIEIIPRPDIESINTITKSKNKTMFQVNVTIGFNPETLAALTALFAGVPKPAEPQTVMLSGDTIQQITSRAQRPSTANGKAIKVTEPVKEPVINGEASEEHEESGEGGAATEVVTIEQVRAAVTVKKQALNSDTGIKGLLAEFGAVDSIGKTKLTELKAADYAEFLTRLEALK